MLTLFLYEEEKNKQNKKYKYRKHFSWMGVFQCCAWKQKGEDLFMKSDSSSQENIQKTVSSTSRINLNTCSSSITWVRGHNDAAYHMLYVQYICNRLLRIEHLHREKSIRISCPVSYSLFQCDKHIITK